MTALIVSPVYAGISTARRAQGRGRAGLWPGLLAAFAGPVGAALLFLIAVVPPSAIWAIVAMSAAVAIGGLVAGRRLAGDAWGHAIALGVLGLIAWLGAIVANLFVDALLIGWTNGIGILIEVALIPVWIWLIVRRRRPNPPPPAGWRGAPPPPNSGVGSGDGPPPPPYLTPEPWQHPSAE